jgi:hypothetical protein
MRMDDSDPNDDRRRFPRIPAEHVVLVTKVGDEVLEQLGRTRDVSLGGCLFTSGQSFGQGSLVQLLIKLEDEVVDCLARIVYEVPKEGDEHDVGVEFVYLSDEQMIASLFT